MNSPTTHNPWLSRFAVLTAVVTFCLVWIGGLVTSHEAGMSVPDWPTSYGYNMFFFPFSKWIGGIFYEHTHRLVASTVGLLTAILALWLWARETSGKIRRNGMISITTILLVIGGMMGARKTAVFVSIAACAIGGIIFGLYQIRRTSGLRWFGIVALSAVILQGILGGLRVTEMKDELGIFHATIAQMFFVFVSAIALFTTKFWNNLPAQTESDRKGLRIFFIAATALILCQLVLGATMRHQHAGLAIRDFPLAYGKIWPDLDAPALARYNQASADGANQITALQIVLQMVHRMMAVVISILVFTAAIRTHRNFGWPNRLTRMAWLWCLLIASQFFLGVATILTGKSADVATAHVAFGALSLLTGGLVSIISFRMLAAPVAQKNAANAKNELTSFIHSSSIAR